MDPYAPIARRLARGLRPLERAREDALRRAREVVRLSSERIRELHRGRWDAAAAKRLDERMRSLHDLQRAHPSLALHGALLQAGGEYVEARLLRAVLEGRPPPDPRALPVAPGSYLLGLGDLVGELRRVILDRLRRGDLGPAQDAFDQMEKVYESLADADVSNALVPLREKVDVARSLVERTRGDLVTAKRAKELEKKIDGIGRLLDEAEGRPQKRAKPRDHAELDLDAAWNRG